MIIGTTGQVVSVTCDTGYYGSGNATCDMQLTCDFISLTFSGPAHLSLLEIIRTLFSEVSLPLIKLKNELSLKHMCY